MKSDWTKDYALVKMEPRTENERILALCEEITGIIYEVMRENRNNGRVIIK